MKYRIRDWNLHYENNRTRELKRMDWVPIPNRMDGDGYTELVDHPNGAAHFGCWIAIIEIASRGKPRGTLPQEGAGIPQALARMSHLPAEMYQEVLPRLEAIGWIEPIAEPQSESVNHYKNQLHARIPQEGAGIPQDDAAKCPRNGTERNGTELRTTRASFAIGDVMNEFPKTSEAVRETYPATDDLFITKLVNEVQRLMLSKGIQEPVKDLIVSEAVRECRKSRTQYSPGLFLTTVPQCVVSWMKHGRPGHRPAPEFPPDPTPEEIEESKKYWAQVHAEIKAKGDS